MGEGSDNYIGERRGYVDVTWREAGEDVGSRGKSSVEILKMG